MSYLTLLQTKKHLNIEDEFTDDDVYIQSLIDVSEVVVEKHINENLTDVAYYNNGSIPLPLLHAMLLMIGNFYQNREIVSILGKATELPYSYKYLLDLYQNY